MPATLQTGSRPAVTFIANAFSFFLRAFLLRFYFFPSPLLPPFALDFIFFFFFFFSPTRFHPPAESHRPTRISFRPGVRRFFLYAHVYANIRRENGRRGKREWKNKERSSRYIRSVIGMINRGLSRNSSGFFFCCCRRSPFGLVIFKKKKKNTQCDCSCRSI